jgi:hypothetical protein
MNPHPPGKFSQLAVAIIVAAIIISATALSYTTLEATVTKTTTSTTTVVLNSSSNTAPMPNVGDCSTPESSDIWDNGLILYANSTSPAYLCVHLYYYSNSTVTQGTAGRVYITGQYPNRTYFSQATIANLFTVSQYPSNVTIGGPTNENEGAAVIYEIQAHPGTNGLFTVDIGNLGPTTFQQPGVTGIGLVTCASEIGISAGNPVPDYGILGTCTIQEQTSTTISGGMAVPEAVSYVQVCNRMRWALDLHNSYLSQHTS